MSPDSEETIKAIAEAVAPVLQEIYGDVLQPGAKQAGKALGTIIGLGNTFLCPLVMLNEISNASLKYNGTVV